MSISHTGLFFSQVEFFNRHITRDYRPAGAHIVDLSHGRRCDWRLAGDGAMRFERACGTPPRLLYFDDPWNRVTLTSQRVIAREPVLGEVVDGGPSPRILSVITMPCANAQADTTPDQRKVMTGHPACTGFFRVALWPERAATLVVRFRGAQLDHAIQAAPGRVVAIPAARETAVRWKVPRGPSVIEVPLDWQDPDGPRMVGAELVSGGSTTELL